MAPSAGFNMNTQFTRFLGYYYKITIILKLSESVRVGSQTGIWHRGQIKNISRINSRRAIQPPSICFRGIMPIRSVTRYDVT